MRKISFYAALFCAGIVSVGCNVGMAPAGPSEAEVKQQISELPPQKQIELIKSSPMNDQQKAERIKQIEEKYHIKDGEAAPPAK